MQVTRTIKIALGDLIAHAFRSMLTALGVVFGVGAVIAVMAISEGGRQAAIAGIEALGIDNIVIRSQQPQGGLSVSSSNNSALEYGVTQRDMDHITRVFDNIALIVPVKDTKQPILKDGITTDVHCFATTPAILDMSNTQVKRGRFFTDADAGSPVPVCVIGTAAARRLFVFRDPLGKNLRIGNRLFRVIGIFENLFESKMLDVHLNNQVFIHFNAAITLFGVATREQKAGGGQTTKVDADFLFIRVADGAQIENTAARLRTYLAERHAVKDYEVQVPYEIMKQKNKTEALFSWLIISIAAISLLVGGIGIMNIMMANIFERTKEIGTRRALGARKMDILVQFLSESILLTIFGGLVGVLLGCSLASLVPFIFEMPTEVTPVSIAVSMVVSVMVGVGFGTYPAWKAANLDPITALRTE